MKILTVDDNTKILFAFDVMLKKEGCLALKATTGKEAIRQIALNQPSAVFLDVSLPDTDGLIVLAQIKQNNPDLPVIIITGHGSDLIREKAFLAGAFAYLEKPLSVEKIRNILNKIRT